jgi:hypothetical protein
VRGRARGAAPACSNLKPVLPQNALRASEPPIWQSWARSFLILTRESLVHQHVQRPARHETRARHPRALSSAHWVNRGLPFSLLSSRRTVVDLLSCSCSQVHCSSFSPEIDDTILVWLSAASRQPSLRRALVRRDWCASRQRLPHARTRCPHGTCLPSACSAARISASPHARRVLYRVVGGVRAQSPLRATDFAVLSRLTFR